jgi:hypothetical protein
MNTIFNLCVNLLVDMSKMLGITYEELNVWLFVIIHPVITLALFVIVLILFRNNRRLKKRLIEQLAQKQSQ